MSADRRIDAREFLDAEAVVDGRHAGPAVLLWKLDAEQPEVGELRKELRWEALGLVPGHDVRPDVCVREFSQTPPQHELFVAEPEIHSNGPWASAVGTRELYHMVRWELFGAIDVKRC